MRRRWTSRLFKISLDRVSKRCPRPRTRRADRLVEVPTIISYSSLQQRTSEQIIDISSSSGSGWTGRSWRPSRCLPETGFNSAFSGADHVDIPVPLMVVVFKVSSPGQGSTASSSSSHMRAGAVDEPWVFRTFPQMKKSARLGPHSGSELGADFNPWTPAAYAESMAGADDESEGESESEVVVEDGAATRFAAGFRPLRVCTRFLEHQMGRPVWGGGGVCLWR